MKKAFDKLSDRERQVLAALIDHYVKSAQPVGSRVLANRYKLGVSPATIRNTLQDLEELGLVTQPHTSAGRIPTDLGYRIYVDLMLKPEQLSAGEKQKIDDEITSAFTPIDQILEQTSRILAEVSSQLGVSTSPEFDRAVLTKMEMIPVAERKLLVVIAVRSGLVKTILMEVDSDLSSSMVVETSGLLNEKLVGLTLGEIRRTISDRFKDVRLGDPRLLRVFTESVNALSVEGEGDSLHVGGTPNMLRQPEFRDREILDQLLGVLESKQPLADMVSSASLKDGVVVTIGKEANIGNFEMCSMVTSTYSAGRSKGTIGVIGPTRMKYSKLVSIVDYTAKLLSKLLSE
ncbi:MAG: heat-inducible transcription repressor HrcA [candidate division Zixibacteria bacterium]|nr:heat-inducible transcription repressor HrcA [candidate division Zixibacteria bacterium]